VSQPASAYPYECSLVGGYIQVVQYGYEGETTGVVGGGGLLGAATTGMQVGCLLFGNNHRLPISHGSSSGILPHKAVQTSRCDISSNGNDDDNGTRMENRASHTLPRLESNVYRLSVFFGRLIDQDGC